MWFNHQNKCLYIHIALPHDLGGGGYIHFLEAHSFSVPQFFKALLSTSYVPGIMQSVEITKVNEAEKEIRVYNISP